MLLHKWSLITVIRYVLLVVRGIRHWNPSLCVCFPFFFYCIPVCWSKCRLSFVPDVFWGIFTSMLFIIAVILGTYHRLHCLFINVGSIHLMIFLFGLISLSLVPGDGVFIYLFYFFHYMIWLISFLFLTISSQFAIIIFLCMYLKINI